jgi:hypothetical protein
MLYEDYDINAWRNKQQEKQRKIKTNKQNTKISIKICKTKGEGL